MTTLAAAVSIGDTQLTIDAPMAAGSFPGWVKIDDELLNVGGQHFRTGTTLVLSAPATATHDSGATVTYAGRPYDADFLAATGGGGGAPQYLVRRGPYRLAHDTPAANGGTFGNPSEDWGYAVGETIAAGSLFWPIAVLIEDFDRAGTLLQLGFGTSASGYYFGYTQLLDTPGVGAKATEALVPHGGVTFSSTPLSGWVRANIDGKLLAAYFTDDGQPETTGEIDLYIWVSEAVAE